MSILTRYLVRQNMFLLFAILLVGTGLYLLTDMFERLDIFIDKDTGLVKILSFFFLKMPAIISQILPAVYFLALVTQLNLLDRSRELIALTAGGVSPAAFIRFIVVYGIIWAFVQLAFAQFIGVEGEKASSRIWQEDVRGNSLEEAHLKGLWFTEENRVVHIGLAYPVQQKGTDILVYTLDDTGIGITEILKAKSYAIEGGRWILRDGSRLIPAEYAATPFETLSVSLSQDLRAFQVGSKSGFIRPNQLSLLELSEAITRLERSGSNVEQLRTAWHGKLAYACSLLVMGMLAYIISRLTGNIYLAVVLSLVIVFFYYVTNTVCSTLGEKGLVAPAVGAWAANAVFALGGTLWLTRVRLRRLWRP